MNKTIKSPGGLTVRVIEALNGFRTKFGYWPTSLELEAGSIGYLATSCLTPLGFFLLQSKVELVVGDDAKILAKGRTGDVFDYGNEGWAGEHLHDAHAWLGLDRWEDEEQ